MSNNHSLPRTSEITLTFENQGLRLDDEEASAYTTSGSGYGTNTSQEVAESTNGSSDDLCSSESDTAKKPKSTNNEGYDSDMVAIDMSEDIGDLNTYYHNPYYIYSDIPSSPPGTPRSERAFGHGIKPFNGSSRSKHSTTHAYTRQLNMFIGEEWENVHENNLNLERRAISCPPSPRLTQLPIIRQPIKTMRIFSNDPTMFHSDKHPPHRAQHSRDSLEYFFFHLSQEEPKTTKDYILKPNPYNNINHKIHSALHCPCFLFFCFLCCLPGVHFMQEGDIEYKSGKETRAKVLGRRSTVCYCLGIVVGIVFLSVAVFVAVQFVQGQVEAENG